MVTSLKEKIIICVKKIEYYNNFNVQALNNRRVGANFEATLFKIKIISCVWKSFMLIFNHGLLILRKKLMDVLVLNFKGWNVFGSSGG